MQELIKRVLRNGQYIPIELQTEMLEKEKEQIIHFHITLMKKGLEQEGNGIEWDYDELRKEAEQHYDETYNQNES